MPPLTSKAQIVRAILLASATDTTLTGRLCSMVRIQSGTFKPRLASLMIEVAPTIKSVRSCRFPRFDIAPSLSFPPLDRALGVSPVQAAKSRAVAKPRASKTDVRTVAAMRGPTPGMLIRRLASGSFLTATKISLSSFSMRVVSSSICSANWIRAKRAANQEFYCHSRPEEYQELGDACHAGDLPLSQFGHMRTQKRAAVCICRPS